MASVALAAVAGVSFGALAVAVRWGLRRHHNPTAGALAALGVATILSAALAAPSVAIGGVEPGSLWPFAVAGLIAPGASQIVLTRAIDLAGASRAALLMATAPLISIAAALTLLGEPLHPVVILGACLIVLGGASLTRERTRPDHFRIAGVALALLCAALFATRDTILRWAAVGDSISPFLAATTSLLAAVTLATAYLATSNPGRFRHLLRAVPAFAPAGLTLAAGYNALIAAFDHGREIIVSPLNATGALWSVLFAAAMMRHSERVGRHTVLAATLIVSGAALIGAER
jgi:drug/metabolite transporter (DMT)-like permease